MTTPPNDRVTITALAELLTSDLVHADRELLLDGVRVAEREIAQHLRTPPLGGPFIAELYRRSGLSWPAFAKAMGMPRTTLLRRAQPYMEEKQQ